MSTHGFKWDAIVVGAGSAGAAAAMHMARGGRRVLMLDARPLGESGARWVNAIPDWMFDESGVSAPTERPELRAKVRRHVMVDPTWTHRVVLEGSPVLFVDMRYLVERVQRAALAAGARVGRRARARPAVRR